MCEKEGRCMLVRGVGVTRSGCLRVGKKVCVFGKKGVYMRAHV